jgi:hypothetical protein
MVSLPQLVVVLVASLELAPTRSAVGGLHHRLRGGRHPCLAVHLQGVGKSCGIGGGGGNL